MPTLSLQSFRRATSADTLTLLSSGYGSVDPVGSCYSASVSRDGRYVAFESNANLVASDTNGSFDVYLRDLQSGALTRVSTRADGSQAENGSFAAYLSADGRYLAFASYEKFVDADTDDEIDTYVRDLQTGTLTLVSGAADGGPSIEPGYNAGLRFHFNCFKAHRE